MTNKKIHDVKFTFIKYYNCRALRPLPYLNMATCIGKRCEILNCFHFYLLPLLSSPLQSFGEWMNGRTKFKEKRSEYDFLFFRKKTGKYRISGKEAGEAW